MAGPERARAAEGALLLWRITAERHGESAFDGEGARLYGGRWNHPGIPVVYTSESLSLAALETFVHLDPDLAPPDLVAAGAWLPEAAEVERLEVSELPLDWRAFPAPEALKAIGSSWADRGGSVALSMPSVVIPRERNFLLNPRHPDSRTIRRLPAEPFSFDPRMWKGGP